MAMILEQMEKEIVCFEKRNQIGILIIKNGKQNKISHPNFLDVNILDKWISSNDIKGIIITGNGRNFCTGADVDDIKANRNNAENFAEELKKGKNILNYIESLPIITVAAISGACFGAGFEIALSCQFRICTTNTLLAFPEASIGIMPGFAGTVRLSEKLGKSKAIEILMTGRVIDSEEAYNLNLVNKVVEKNTHIEEAINFIDDITKERSIQQINSIVAAVNNATNKKDREFAMIKEGEFFAQLIKNMR